MGRRHDTNTYKQLFVKENSIFSALAVNLFITRHTFTQEKTQWGLHCTGQVIMYTQEIRKFYASGGRKPMTENSRNVEQVMTTDIELFFCLRYETKFLNQSIRDRIVKIHSKARFAVHDPTLAVYLSLQKLPIPELWVTVPGHVRRSAFVMLFWIAKWKRMVGFSQIQFIWNEKAFLYLFL